MSLLQSKQINAPLISYVGMAGFTTGATATDNLTAALTTVYATATNSGGPVPVGAGSVNATTGVLTAGVALNIADDFLPMFKTGTKMLLTDANSNDVYGTLALAAGVFTVSYWSNIAGVKTAYTFLAATVVDFEIPTWFSLSDLPADALIGYKVRHVGADNNASRYAIDSVTPTATNVLPALTQIPNGKRFFVIINGQVVNGLVPANGVTFTTTTTAVTVSSALLGFNVGVNDSIYIEYTY